MNSKIVQTEIFQGVSTPAQASAAGGLPLRRFIRPSTKTAPFPFVSTDDLSLLAEPEETWGALLEDLSKARETILFESFIFVDGEAADAVVTILCDRASAGVHVHLHVDGYGSIALSRELERKLVKAGVVVRRFNNPRLKLVAVLGIFRYHRRSHRRIVTIDGNIGWVGGLAIDDRWWPRNDSMTTRDAMLRIQGQLVSQLEKAFWHFWDSHHRSMPARPIEPAKLGEARVVPHHPFLARRFRSVLHHRILSSKHRIWLATPYFIPKGRLRRALCHSAQRGIDVRLYLPGPRYHDHPLVRVAAHRHYGKLLEAGVKIFEFRPTFLHGKIAMFDSDWTVIGSANLDRLSFFHNYELLVEAKNTALANQTYEEFCQIGRHGDEISLSEWNCRPLWGRILERICGLFDRIL